MDEFVEWRKSLEEEEEIPHHVKDSYNKALKLLEEIKVFEEDLVRRILFIQLMSC